MQIERETTTRNRREGSKSSELESQVAVVPFFLPTTISFLAPLIVLVILYQLSSRTRRSARKEGKEERLKLISFVFLLRSDVSLCPFYDVIRGQPTSRSHLRASLTFDPPLFRNVAPFHASSGTSSSKSFTRRMLQLSLPSLESRTSCWKRRQPLCI